MRNKKLAQISGVNSFQFVVSPRKNQKGITGKEPKTNCHPAITVGLFRHFFRFIQTVPRPKETAPTSVQVAPKYAWGKSLKSWPIKKNKPNSPKPRPLSCHLLGVSFN